MSCAGKGTLPESNAYLYTQYFSGVVPDYNNIRQSTRNCRKYASSYPSFTPVIGNMTSYTSKSGEYNQVYINGSNFLPYGTTVVNFGTDYKNIPVIYYSSMNISFVVPAYAQPGKYNVNVVNIYNGNFSPAVNITYAGIPNYSNTVEYIIT